VPSAPDGRFGSLTPQTLEAYIARHRADDGLWVFQHIPKTAGSSLANEIAHNRRRYRNINVAKQPGDLTHEARLDAAAEMFLADNAARRFRSASGHIRREHLDLIRADIPGTRTVTFLREPVARLVSDYRYARTPMHPNWQEVIRQTPDFDSYISLRGTHNKMAWFLFGRNNIPVTEAVERMFAEFDFIGVQDQYEPSFILLSTLLWEAQAPALRKRITETTPDNQVELTDSQRDRILEQNALDLALYQAASARIAAIAPFVSRPEDGATSVQDQ